MTTTSRRLRALGGDELARLAGDLRALADEMAADHAVHVQRLMEVEADSTWASRSSGAGPSSRSVDASPVEQAAGRRLGGGDRLARDAARALERQRRVAMLARLALVELRAAG